MIYSNKIGETFYEHIWVRKGGGGGLGDAEEASEMHGPRKSTYMLLSLSLLDTLDTYTCRLLHELYGVVVCPLKNMCHTVASTFRISSHVQN